MARQGPRCWRGTSQNRGPRMARQAPLGNRLSGQGRSGRGETHVNMFLKMTALRATRRLGLVALIAAALVALAAQPAHATNIERLITPGGIEVWMVRDATVPLIALDFA